MATRRATLKKRPVNVQTTTVFVVACEGAETERIYFEFIQKLIESDNEDFRFRIKALAVGSGPKGVLAEMQSFLKQNDVTRADHAWLVMDVDHHTHNVNRQILESVLQKAEQQKVRVALSNACFEVWLMLHLTDSVPIVPSTQMERETKKVWPAYNKSQYKAEHLQSGIASAIKRAKIRDSSPADVLPIQSGTRVYQLMETLREAIKKVGGTSPF